MNRDTVSPHAVSTELSTLTVSNERQGMDGDKQTEICTIEGRLQSSGMRLAHQGRGLADPLLEVLLRGQVPMGMCAP